MKAVAITDRGLVRPKNEDTVYCSVDKVGNLPNLFVVADGMGGANAGEYASAFAMSEVISKIRNDNNRGEHLSVIRDAIESANRDLYADACRNAGHYGCGTTIVAAVVEDDTVYVANVGDSRLYIIGASIRQITHDHSYVEEMVKQGRMVRGSRDYLSKKNIITRAVGSSEDIEIDFFEEHVSSGETILLCTDGLSNMLDDDTIFRIVTKAASVEEAAQKLVEAANSRGGRDNITVVVVSEL